MKEPKRYKHMTLFGNPCLCVSADDYDALRAENERLKAVPMKYKRMEHNAKLQAEVDALRAENAELELLADDACGKRCPDCGAPMVSLSTIDGGQRVCSGCNKTWDWHLKKGQQPLIGNNRMVNKV